MGSLLNSMSRTDKAAKAYEDFTGHKPRQVKRSRLDDTDVNGWKMGPVVGIAYEATRDNETQRYFHEFNKKTRPDLIARDDGRQLYIDGGKYKVTDRGIEDMPQLFVVNPSPRAGSRKKASPMRRRRATTKRRATRQVAVFRANPVRRRRRRSTVARRRATYRRNPIALRSPIRRRRRARTSVARRSYRRNPSARAGAVNFGKMLLPAAGIGLGAVGSEIIMGYLPIPANFKTGVMRHITKGAVGVAAGMIVSKVFKQKRLGNYLALGAVVIAVHDAVKEFIAARMPAVQMGQYRGPIGSSFGGHRGGMGYASPAQIVSGMGQYVAPIPSTFTNKANGGGGEFDFAV